MKAFLDACTGSSDFQGIVLIDGPPCSATARRAIWSNSTAPGLLRTWLQQAIDDRQIDALRAVLAGNLSLAGRGRSLAEAAAEPAPAGIREDIRAVVAARASFRPGRSLPRRGTVAVIACAGARGVPDCAAAMVMAGNPARCRFPGERAGRRPGQLPPGPAAGYLGASPGSTRPVPARLAPGRRGGRARGRRCGHRVRLPGRRRRPRHPLPQHAAVHRGSRGTRTARPRGRLDGPGRGVAVLCGRGAHSLLILGPDPAIVRHVGALLGGL